MTPQPHKEGRAMNAKIKYSDYVEYMKKQGFEPLCFVDWVNLVERDHELAKAWDKKIA